MSVLHPITLRKIINNCPVYCKIIPPGNDVNVTMRDKLCPITWQIHSLIEYRY